MLYVKYKNALGSSWTQILYVPSLQIDNRNMDDVNHIIADGDEIDYIIKLFGYSQEYKRACTIPLTSRQSMAWYGDLAKTILANL